MSKNYQLLIKKIELFIRKYYKNQLIKGFLLSMALIVSFFLLVIALEYNLHLSKTVRTFIFYSYIISGILILFYYIIKPLAGLLSLGKRLTHSEAAQIIGHHFPNVSDKLLNTLQLYENFEKINNSDIWLLEAAVEQKSENLSSIPFYSAISFSINKKYLKFFLPPIFILLILYGYLPKSITESSERIINYDVEYIEKAPFSFEIQNPNLECLQSNDFTLKVKIIGKTIPDKVVIVIDNYPFSVIRKNNVSFEYVFKTVLSNKSFYFKAGKYKSQHYILHITPRPKIISFSVAIKYPHYLHKKDELISNAGDFSLAEGSTVKWKFITKDVNKLDLLINSKTIILKANSDIVESAKIKLYKSSIYKLIPINNYLKKPDTLYYNIDIVKDQYPNISVNEYRDSLDEKHIYFQGSINDDYGFSKLLFKWSITTNSTVFKQKEIEINNTENHQKFFYSINIDSLNIKEGEKIKYYFEIWDNDGVNGAKSAKTLINYYKKASYNELDSARNKINTDIKKQMEKSIKDAQELNKKSEKLTKKLISKKELDWQDKEQLKELLKQYNKTLKNITELQKKQKKSQEKSEELSKEDKRLMEKQEQLQKLFDKLITPEMKEMMEELQKMMQKEIKKEQAQDMLDKMQLNNKDIEKQLDRDLEIFKQMEFDQKLQEAINQLDSLKSKQEKLSKQTKEKQLSEKELQKNQEELNKKFDEFKKKLDDAEKANKELEKPNSLEDTKTEQENIKDKMQKSSEELSKGKKNAASKMQKSASESMQKLSEKLKQMQSEMESEANEENIEDLKNILNNLIETSFSQEALMIEVKSTSKSNPNYPNLIRKQKDIKNNLQMIEDSLLALSKRQPSISPMVNKEINHINLNMNKTLNALLSINTIGYTSKKQKDAAIGKQQQIMTSVNNLALMLFEALEQMQKQQQQAKNGKGSCKKPKPGKSGGSMKSIKQMQQALNKKLKEMQKKMKEGNKEGGKKKGRKSNNGEQMSEEMARSAAEQEMIRRKLQEYQNALKKTGKGKRASDLNKTIKDMEQNETELVNNILLSESIKRQEEIVTRLLEAEKAEREQKEDKQRESEEGKDINRDFSPQMKKFFKKQNKEIELLKTIPPNMKPFYKNKVNSYFEELNK